MTKKLNKKGTSLVELIAVIVIMGIIAAIAIPTTIGVINRQKEKAAVESANNVIAAAKTVLLEEFAGTDVASVSKIADTNIYYTTNAALKESGDLGTVKVDGGNVMFVLYDGVSFSVKFAAAETVLTDTDFVEADVTGGSVDGVSVKFVYEDCKFVKA